MITQENAKVDMRDMLGAWRLALGPTRKIKAGEPLIALLRRDGRAIHQ
jgi:hypothetical protein